MTSSLKNIKTKIALHSFGVAFILLILIIFSLLFSKYQILPYSLAGALTGEILRIILSKKKYLISIHQTDSTISISYFNRILIRKSVIVDKENLNIFDVTETNWWYGRLDLINFSNGRQNLSFDYIDKNLKQSILEKLDVV